MRCAHRDELWRDVLDGGFSETFIPCSGQDNDAILDGTEGGNCKGVVVKLGHLGPVPYSKRDGDDLKPVGERFIECGKDIGVRTSVCLLWLVRSKMRAGGTEPTASPLP